MMLCDASPLIAIVDKRQMEAHVKCVSALSTMTSPLITTWPCFVEAMYLLGSVGGWSLQKALWGFYERHTLRFYDLTLADAHRMRTLMEKYRDVPMDLADDSLVVTAEVLDLKRIFTLDSDFYIYRKNERDSFEITP